MVGSAIARDLVRDADLTVTAVDASSRSLERLSLLDPTVRTQQADLADPKNLRQLVRRYDLVVGALPSRLGMQALEVVCEAGKRYVDIAFMADDPAPLDAVAKKNGAIAVVDCGVAPGLSNMLVGLAANHFAEIDSVTIYVGGLPVARDTVWDYKAPFAPSDVIEEYVRPARFRENGVNITETPLGRIEHLEFEDVGTLEAFLTDGLRSLVTTIAAPNMIEKTLRYPGHAQAMERMRDSGFFEEQPLVLRDGTTFSPLKMTSILLFDSWRYKEGEADLTVMRVVVEGRTANGVSDRMQWELSDRYDPATKTRSMSRTTGYTAALTARHLLAGAFDEPGVHPPESLRSTPRVIRNVIDGLRERGIVISESHPPT
jgi:saccharopine dehydrogenase-like NADP-dependent oxidoreductase